jgi:hypothetical protein
VSIPETLNHKLLFLVAEAREIQLASYSYSLCLCLSYTCLSIGVEADDSCGIGLLGFWELSCLGSVKQKADEHFEV